MDKEKIIQELKMDFKKLKQDLGFKSSFDELENIFFITDFVLKEGYVSDQLSRQICGRIVNTYMNWNNYLHGVAFPSPGNMMIMAESNIFNDDEKKKINKLMSKAMGLVSTNTLVGITKDKKVEAKFIDDSVSFWNRTFKPEIEKIMKKVNDNWNKED